MNLIKILKSYPKHSQPKPGNMTYGAPPPGAGSPPPADNTTGTTGASTTANPGNTGPIDTVTPGGQMIENLTTIGGEYTYINGKEYIGDYHIHPNMGAMVGAKHKKSNHAMLLPMQVTPNPGNKPSFGDPKPKPAGTPNGASGTVDSYDPVIWNGQIPYIEKGLLYKNKTKLFARRDDAGNIMFKSNISGSVMSVGGDGVGIQLGQKLHIEGVAENIDMGSFLETKKTNFNYFKFPATVKINQLPISIPEIEDVTLDIDTTSFYYVRMKPSEDFRFGQATWGGILMDDLVYGSEQMGARGGIKITPEFAQTGNPLRILVKVHHKYLPVGNTVLNGTMAFSLIKYGPGGKDREFRYLYQKPHLGSYPNQLTGFQSGYADINNNATFNGEDQQQFWPNIYPGYLDPNTMGPGVAKIIFAEFIIPSSEFVTGDRFNIGVKSRAAPITLVQTNKPFQIISDSTFLIGMDATLGYHLDDNRLLEFWKILGNQYRVGGSPSIVNGQFVASDRNVLAPVQYKDQE